MATFDKWLAVKRRWTLVSISIDLTEVLVYFTSLVPLCCNALKLNQSACFINTTCDCFQAVIWCLLDDLGSSLWRGAVIAAKWVLAVSLSADFGENSSCEWWGWMGSQLVFIWSVHWRWVETRLGECDIEKNIFSITIIRRYFAECVIVLIFDYRGQLQFMIFFIFCVLSSHQWLINLLV